MKNCVRLEMCGTGGWKRVDISEELLGLSGGDPGLARDRPLALGAQSRSLSISVPSSA